MLHRRQLGLAAEAFVEGHFVSAQILASLASARRNAHLALLKAELVLVHERQLPPFFQLRPCLRAVLSLGAPFAPLALVPTSDGLPRWSLQTASQALTKRNALTRWRQ